jgi:hypothetical protein
MATDSYEGTEKLDKYKYVPKGYKATLIDRGDPVNAATWKMERVDGLTEEQVKVLEERDIALEEAQRIVGCDGAVSAPWKGMWLCIEQDGYTHT